MVIANDKNTFRKKTPSAYRFRYKIPKNKASFAVQPLWLTIESERNFENCYKSLKSFILKIYMRLPLLLIRGTGVLGIYDLVFNDNLCYVGKKQMPGMVGAQIRNRPGKQPWTKARSPRRVDKLSALIPAEA